MNPLVPEFILLKDQEAQDSGVFQGAALFVDIAGFTALTSKLMEHGREGAEALVHALRFYFDPLVAAVHEGGGFITGFAGDACTALFPESPLRNAAEYALDAADRMQRFVAKHPVHDTRFGSFAFSIRVGLSWGKVAWSIVSVSDARAYATFHGPAIDGSAAVEHEARSGDVLLDAAFRRRVPRADATHVTGDMFRQIGAPPLSQRLRPSWIPLSQRGARFLAPGITTLPPHGEFRDVVSVFLGFDGAIDLPPLVTLLDELATRYGGTFTGLDFGDKGASSILHFGAPVAHENDTERALDFALELRRACPAPIRLRGGITRDIRYVGFNGGTRRHEFACLGRATNLAARLMMKASWDQFLCGERVAADARGSYLLVPQGELALKGFDAPVPAFALERQRPPSIRATFSSKELVGRAAEITALEEALAPLFGEPAESAGVIHIDGGAGLGKSHLVEALRRRIEARVTTSIRWIEAPCDQTLQRAVNAFESALKETFHQSAAASREDNRAALDDALDRLIERLPASEGELLCELEEARSIFAALVGIRRDGSLHTTIDRRERFGRTIAAIAAWVRAESLLAPVLLHVEDAQWADPDTVRAIESIARMGRAGAPIAVLCTARYRDDGTPFRIALDHGTPIAEIAVGPLSPEEIGRIADNAAGRRVPEIFRALLVDHAGGNPFYTEEIVTYWTDSEMNSAVADATLSASSVALLPSDVNSVLIARLDRLPPSIKSAVLTAAVLGRDFDPRVLARMLDDRASVAEHLLSAEAQGIWTPLDRDHYRFHSTLLRNAAYEIQARARLERLHLRAAEAIEAVHAGDLDAWLSVLARHYRRAGAAARARHYFLRAARQSVRCCAHAEAKRHYSGYLKLVEAPTPESLVARYEFARDVLEISGDLARARDEHGQVIAEALALRDRSSEALGWLGLGRVRWSMDELDEALGCLAQARAIGRSAMNRWTESRVLAHMALVHKAQGHAGEAFAIFEEALAIGASLGIDDESTIFGGIVQQFAEDHRARDAFAKYERAMAVRS